MHLRLSRMQGIFFSLHKCSTVRQQTDRDFATTFFVTRPAGSIAVIALRALFGCDRRSVFKRELVGVETANPIPPRGAPRFREPA
jgi:hypothetical protein